jgi:hypothetical protein
MFEKPKTDKETKKISVKFLQELIEAGNSGYNIPVEKIYEIVNETEKYNDYLEGSKIHERYNYGFSDKAYSLLNRASSYHDLNKDYLIRYNARRALPCFTTNGFKKFCLLLDTNASKYVYEYIAYLENIEIKVVEQSGLIKEMKSELQEVNDKLNKSIKENIAYRQRFGNLPEYDSNHTTDN